MSARDILKAVALRSGGLDALHRWRNRWCLTVVMFHRVLPPPDLVRFKADPLYTITTPLFSETVAFLQRHFAVVSLDDVLASRSRRRPLPPRSLLITFDDGWRDTMDHASPILRAAGVPWTLFAATDALAEPECWWQESLLWALRSGAARYPALMKRAACTGSAGQSDPAQDPTLAILSRFGALSPDDRRTILAPFHGAVRRQDSGYEMLSLDDVRTLHGAGVAIGAHGASHLPLAGNPDGAAELDRARRVLSSAIGPSAVTAMSFPHGRYDRRAVRAAREIGYRLLFTSDAILNQCPGGWVGSDVLGRIPIAARAIANSAGRLDPGRLATHLFLRPRRCVGSAERSTTPAT